MPATRNEDGSPVDVELTLRADAVDYLTFPSGVRQALPVDISEPVEEDGALIVSSTLTEIGLLALPAGPVAVPRGQ